MRFLVKISFERFLFFFSLFFSQGKSRRWVYLIYVIQSCRLKKRSYSSTLIYDYDNLSKVSIKLVRGGRKEINLIHLTIIPYYLIFLYLYSIVV